jgi:putative spermidine/putrescine transport system substrate-binding protein
MVSDLESRSRPIVNSRAIVRAAGARWPVNFHSNQALFVSDSLVISRGPKNKKEAMDFIAFSMEPQEQANFSKQIPYGPTNQKALPLLDKARLAVLPSSPENLAHGVSRTSTGGRRTAPKSSIPGC